MTRKDLLNENLLKIVFEQLQDTNNILLASNNFDSPDKLIYCYYIHKLNINNKEVLTWRYYGSSANSNTFEDFKWLIENIFTDNSLIFWLTKINTIN